MHVLALVLPEEPPKVRSQPAPPSLRSLSFQRHLLYFHISEKETCFPEDNKDLESRDFDTAARRTGAGSYEHKKIKDYLGCRRPEVEVGGRETCRRDYGCDLEDRIGNVLADIVVEGADV